MEVDSKIHGTTGLVPLKELSKEPLLPLPKSSILDLYRFEARIVSSDGFESYDGVRYVIPWHYSGRELRVRMKDDRVQVFDDPICVADHEAQYHSNRYSLLPGQYQGLAQNNGLPVKPPYGKTFQKKLRLGLYLSVPLGVRHPEGTNFCQCLQSLDLNKLVPFGV